MAQPGFWNNPTLAREKIDELKKLSDSDLENKWDKDSKNAVGGIL